MAIRKSAAEIETMLMDRLRGNRSCNTLERVAVMRGDDDGRWNAHPQMKPGKQLTFDCGTAIAKVASEFSSQYLLTPED
jgi:hypothetical protein